MNLSRNTCAILLTAIAASYGVIALPHDSLAWLLREDGPVENLGAIGLAVSALLLIMKASLIRRSQGFKSSLPTAIIALFLLIACMEEISWGQRILGFSVPRWFVTHSEQQETNIHNLQWFRDETQTGGKNSWAVELLSPSRIFTMFWVGWCVALPLIARVSLRVQKLADNLSIPVIPIGVGLLFAANLVIGRIVWFISPAIDIQELKECNYELLYVLTAISQYANVTLVTKSPWPSARRELLATQG